MDKELTEITPTNLDGTEVNTVKKATEEEAKAAAVAEKEEKENYYVDPLEQEALMKEKLEKIEAEKEQRRKENLEEEEASMPEIDASIRPDMNVSGYFSTGNTAVKQSVLHRPASKGFLNFCMIFGVIDAIYSAFYFIALISDNFASANWFMGWLYAIVVIISVIIIFNSVRSLKVQKNSLKQKAMIGIVGSAIAGLPLIAWLFHWISQLF